MTSSSHDLAHLGHVELLTPRPEASLDFLVRVMGLTVSAQEGDSAYRRGWDDYEFHTLELTAAATNGLRHLAFRAASDEALQRRVEAVEAAGLGLGWTDGDLGHGRAYRYRTPDGHLGELYYETRWYEPNGDTRPALKNQAARFPARGANLRRLDHLNLLASRVAPMREFSTGPLGCLLSEEIVFSEAERRTGQAWGLRTIASFHTHGMPSPSPAAEGLES
jgi:catechol 2,3-dioxygenase